MRLVSHVDSKNTSTFVSVVIRHCPCIPFCIYGRFGTSWEFLFRYLQQQFTPAFLMPATVARRAAAASAPPTRVKLGYTWSRHATPYRYGLLRELSIGLVSPRAEYPLISIGASSAVDTAGKTRRDPKADVLYHETCAHQPQFAMRYAHYDTLSSTL
jgi:hypothetical protein